MSGLYCEATGTGTPVVLVHGWGTHGGIWESIGDVLSAGHALCIPDLPGHGRSHQIEAPTLGAMVDTLATVAPAEAVWIGWSLGGLVTLAAAVLQPQKVQKAILVGATPNFSKRPHWKYGVDTASCQAFSEALENSPAETLEQFWLQCYGAASVEESLRLLGKSTVMDGLPADTDLKAGLRLLYDNDLLSELRNCNVPTLFLGGTRDRTVLPESFTYAAALMPSGEARLVRGAGHAPFITHRDEFLAIIRGYLNGENTA